jgi:hypothetical protein
MRSARIALGGTMKLGFGIIILCTSMNFIGCASLQRSSESGYNQSPQSTFVRKQLHRSSGDEISVKPAKINVSGKMQLKQLENSLSTQKEMEQYSKVLPWFRDEEERIRFLAIKGFESRQEWLDERNFTQRSKQTQNEFKDLVDVQDIAIGMPQNLVRKSWGDPDSVDVSGNPALKNERWKYARFISSSEGYKPEKKVVYFEGGRVIGWEVE